MKLEKTELIKKIVDFAKDEYKDYLVYKTLAQIDPKNRDILIQLSKQELYHFNFWKRFLEGKNLKFKEPKLTITIYKLLYRIFGPTFTIKLLERHEKEVIKNYKKFLKYLKGKNLEELKKILKDEISHENKLIKLLNDKYIAYIGFVALGLADSIIEVTGVHTGMLGLTTSTILAGLTGLIVGFSASISMGVSAYLQAKHSRSKNPIRAGLVTGGFYLLSVILLSLPYFLFSEMIKAFVASILLGAIVIGLFTFYSSVISGKQFLREFLENLTLILTVAFGAYLFGDFLGKIFGIHK
ncbi:MAG: VIT1/CCC1 family protein [Candidatus Aenigmatarchaeota archaeon]